MTSKTLLRRMRKSLVRNLISKSSNMFFTAGAHLLLPFLHIFYDKNIYIIVIYDKIFLTRSHNGYINNRIYGGSYGR